jgi:hypothetical protein
MGEKEDLEAIFADDELGLLESKAKAKSQNRDERLNSSFEEINLFVDTNGREPDRANGMMEMRLASRLKGFRENDEKGILLKEFDRHNLLGEIEIVEKEPDVEEAPPQSLDDLLNDDDLGLLGGEDSIYKMRFVKPYSQIEKPDFVAQRKKCENFTDYEHLFNQCKRELEREECYTERFSNETQITKGQFFILNGIMVYVNNVEKLKRINDGKVNGRLHLIFDNGTESNMLLRSLATALYSDENGRRVIKPIGQILKGGVSELEEEDKFSGLVYVLKSLSKEPQIQSIKNLYKIGFSTGSVEKRIANAKKEATYLMADVKVIATYKCFNMSPKKFEELLHTFFQSVRLNVAVMGLDGTKHDPREWFIAPFEIIEKAIEMIMDGSIIGYKYSIQNQSIQVQ